MRTLLKKDILEKIVKAAFLTVCILLLTLSGGLCKLPDGAYIHIGDTLVYVAALVFPLYISLPAAALGCAFADLVLGSVNYFVATLVIKALTVLVARTFVKMSEKALTQDLLISLSGAVTIGGYYIFDVLGLMFSGKGVIFAMTKSFDHITYNVLQALICATLYVAVAGIARRAAFREKQEILQGEEEK